MHARTHVCVRACTHVCMYVYMHARMYVCMYVYMHARMYAMLLIDGLHLGCQRGPSSTPRLGRPNIFFIHLAITLCMDNQISCCSYYVQLSVALCKQLQTIV